MTDAELAHVGDLLRLARQAGMLHVSRDELAEMVANGTLSGASLLVRVCVLEEMWVCGMWVCRGRPTLAPRRLVMWWASHTGTEE
eukprot:26743-Chlamydomonas_euryale.AAC.1